jgi:hypothetical protein
MLGNLGALSSLRAAKEMQDTYNHGQPFAGQADYSALYYAALFGVVAGIAFVIAFVNAVRGTLVYRALVQAGRAADKQEALNREDRLAVRRRVMGTVQRIWRMVPASWTSSAWTTARKLASPPTPRVARREPIPFPAPAATPPSAPAPAVVPSEAATAVGEIRPAFATVPAAMPAATPAYAAAVPAPVSVAAPAIDQFPAYDDAPEVASLADLIGSNPFRWTRAGLPCGQYRHGTGFRLLAGRNSG